MTHKGPGQLRLLGATLGAVLAVVVLAGPASARVSMHSFEARSGGTDVGLTLRVPNEKDNASTVTVRVALPLGTPLIGVLVRPLAGWAATVTTAKLAKPVKTDDGTITEAASQITWTGGRIGPGQYQDFDFEVSSFPWPRSWSSRSCRPTPTATWCGGSIPHDRPGASRGHTVPQR